MHDKGKGVSGTEWLTNLRHRSRHYVLLSIAGWGRRVFIHSFIVTPVAPVHNCNRACLFSAPLCTALRTTTSMNLEGHLQALQQYTDVDTAAPHDQQTCCAPAVAFNTFRYGCARRCQCCSCTRLLAAKPSQQQRGGVALIAPMLQTAHCSSPQHLKQYILCASLSAITEPNKSYAPTYALFCLNE